MYCDYLLFNSIFPGNADMQCRNFKSHGGMRPLPKRSARFDSNNGTYITDIVSLYLESESPVLREEYEPLTSSSVVRSISAQLNN